MPFKLLGSFFPVRVHVRPVVLISAFIVSVFANFWPVRIACAQDAARNPPPPGKLVDLGGWRMHLHCTGRSVEGAPTVVLEAGAGDSSIEWSLVQPRVARFARVCSYDRSGSAWSDLGPYPHTGRQIVYELRTLLARAKERPPYLLVGHSMGGRYVRMFATAYRELAAGLVLVDANHEDDLLFINGKFIRQWETATGKEVPAVKTSMPLRLEDLPADVREKIEAAARDADPQADHPPYNQLPRDARIAREWAWSQPKHFAANNSPFEGDEALALRTERQTVQHPLGDLPLVVLTRGLPVTGPRAEQIEPERKQHQTELVSLSSAGQQTVANGSGHHIHIDEPAAVVDAIRDVLMRSANQ